jgi:hypothetical protein
LAPLTTAERSDDSLICWQGGGKQREEALYFKSVVGVADSGCIDWLFGFRSAVKLRRQVKIRPCPAAYLSLDQRVFCHQGRYLAGVFFALAAVSRLPYERPGGLQAGRWSDLGARKGCIFGKICPAKEMVEVLRPLPMRI